MQESQQSGSAGFGVQNQSSGSPDKPGFSQINENKFKTPSNNNYRVDQNDGTYTDYSRDIKGRPNFNITNNNMGSDMEDNTIDKSLMNMTGGHQ